MKFSIFGVAVEVTFLYVAIISFIISLNTPTNVLVTIISSVFHEFGHIVMMTIVDSKPKKVKFELVGINIIRNEDVTISVKNEILIALGGPLANGIICFFCCLFLCFYKAEIIMTIACVNLILMTFNLLPIKKLDGGLALYYLLSHKFDSVFSSIILKLTSLIFVAVIFCWGINILILSGYNVSLIIIAIFLTLSMFCDNEY